MLLEQAEVLGFLLVGHIQVGFVCNFLVGHESLCLGFKLVDELVNHFLVQGDRRIHIPPLIKGADVLVLGKGNFVLSRVGDGNLADSVVVERDLLLVYLEDWSIGPCDDWQDLVGGGGGGSGGPVAVAG